MNIKYLSMLSAIMLVGSGFVSAMESYDPYNKPMSSDQSDGFSPEAELGKLKGPTKLTRGKYCDKKYKDCLESGKNKEECDSMMKNMCGDKPFSGKTCFGTDEECAKIHGKQNPYRKFDKKDLRATYYGDSQSIGLGDNPFDNVSESEEQPNELDYSTGSNGIYE